MFYDTAVRTVTQSEIDGIDPPAAAQAVTFTVGGVPVPRGSGDRMILQARCPWCHKTIPRSSGIGKQGPWVDAANVRTQTKPGNRLKAWMTAIGWHARAAGCVLHPKPWPVSVELSFYLPRNGHRCRGAVFPPDIDKLTRAALDALTGIAYADDAQVTLLLARKRWATEAADCGAHITIRRI